MMAAASYPTARHHTALRSTRTEAEFMLACGQAQAYSYGTLRPGKYLQILGRAILTLARGERRWRILEAVDVILMRNSEI